MPSLCTYCLDEVPSYIVDTGSQIVIVKNCPTCGQSTGVVEKDPAFYWHIKSQNASTIYPGLFIDITGECNLNCRYCYHDKQSEHKSLENIMNQARQYSGLAPFFLTGGEPTTHPNIMNIITNLRIIGPVGIVSNGTMTRDKHVCAAIAQALNYGGDTIAIGLSYHPEGGNAVSNTLDNLAAMGKKASSVLFVIDQLEQIDECINFYQHHKNIDHIRIKAGTALWNEAKHSGIYVSDMLKYLSGCQLDYTQPNKTSFVNIIYNNIPIMLVSWYTRHNVDIDDIDCPPYYLAKDGSLNNLVISCIKNEEKICRQ